MKKTTWKDIVIIVISLSFLAIMIFLKIFISNQCIKTNSPLIILFDVMFSDCAVIIVLFTLTVFLCSIGVKSLREIKNTSPLKIIIAVFMLSLIISSLFPLSRNYGYVKVNGKEPIKVQYCYYLFKDAITDDTVSTTINPEDFYLEHHSYTVRGRRGSRSHSYTAHYASFKDYSVLIYINTMDSYITLCKNNNIDIEIEYYKNSGIIKTINGMKLYDDNEFSDAFCSIGQKEIKKQAEENAIKEEDERKKLALFTAFFNSEGENYDEIARNLEKEGVENTYEIKYISTQYYEVGHIAFFDNTEHVVYVVGDNNGEDMIEIPSLPYKGTFTEVTQILDEHGIKWTFDCLSNSPSNTEGLDHSKDILNTVHCCPGTPVPKDYVFWFSVNHVG